MVFFLLALFIICLIKIKVRRPDTGLNFMEKDQTTAINGIFVILIVLLHSSGYLSFEPILINDVYLSFKGILGQFIVVPFLFYSGFGIMKSIMGKDGYIKTFPKKRFFKVWYHFAIAVILFLILDLIVGDTYSLKTILLSFTGFESVGNSNWFIFATFELYIIVYIVFSLVKNKKIATYLVAFLTAILVVVERYVELGSYYYNTMLMFPLGMLYCLYSEKINKILFSKTIVKVLVLFLSLAGFCAMYLLSTKVSGAVSFVLYELKIIFGMLFILEMTSLFEIKNKILIFLGKNAFGIYIIQRIPMIIFNKIGLSSSPYLFVALSLVLAVALGFLFDFLLGKLDKKIISK